ncbi:hypothetical protein CTAYLR_002025 [Chrysophaeum taylorii]|uniref:Anoctamin-like protein n=1 Tax=Chrysophaeum taylorii TaxID=2483200 RepID=A0AAD7UP10_9STRA|nr:hypothetical protein CTAYLR_002025 [Chrysophaeum taylorii]
MLYMLGRLIEMARENMVKKWRRNERDGFYGRYGYSWDWCLVFKVHEASARLSREQRKNSVRCVVEKLTAAGLETKMCFTARLEEVAVKVRASEERLARQAALNKYRLQLDPVRLESKASMGKKVPGTKDEWVWRPLRIRDPKKICRYEPFEHAFAAYREREDEAGRDLWRRYGGASVFRGSDRIKLLKSAIETEQAQGGAALSIAKLKRAKCVVAAFPLHDHDELFELEQQWLRYWQLPNNQPFDTMAAYFGERLTLYFAWVAHYTTYLSYAAGAGFVAWVWSAAERSSNAVGVALFALFATVWSTSFEIAWARRQSQFAMRWGSKDLAKFEFERLEFVESGLGRVVPSPVTGRSMRWVPPHKRRSLCVRAYCVIVVLVAAVVALVAAQFVSKTYVYNYKKRRRWWRVSVPTLFGGITAAQISAMNFVYDKVARKLNDLENHRTQSEYDDALALKTVLFSFVNSYSTLVYIAFVKPFTDTPCVGGADDHDCIAELSAQLGSIFGFGLVVNNLQEIGKPAFQNYLALDRAAVVDEDEDNEYYVQLTSVEEQFLLQDYTIEETLFKDYVELMIQFGYATLFSAAFPLAPLLAMINNYVEIRVDAWKLCQQTKRAEPASAETIGTWQTIISALSLLAVQTNAMLVCFTGLFFENLAGVHRLALFLLFEHLVFFAKFVVHLVSSRVDPDVEMQLARAEFITSKVLLNVPDDPVDLDDAPDWEPNLTTVQPDLTVHLLDDNLEKEYHDTTRRLAMPSNPDRAAV